MEQVTNLIFEHPKADEVIFHTYNPFPRLNIGEKIWLESFKDSLTLGEIYPENNEEEWEKYGFEWLKKNSDMLFQVKDVYHEIGVFEGVKKYLIEYRFKMC